MAVLRTSDDQAASAAAITVDGQALSRVELFEAAAAVADRAHGAAGVALEADATLRTVVSVVGCLLAGVPVVPVATQVRRSEATSFATRAQTCGLGRHNQT